MLWQSTYCLFRWCKAANTWWVEICKRKPCPFARGLAHLLVSAVEHLAVHVCWTWGRTLLTEFRASGFLDIHRPLCSGKVWHTCVWRQKIRVGDFSDKQATTPHSMPNLHEHISPAACRSGFFPSPSGAMLSTTTNVKVTHHAFLC